MTTRTTPIPVEVADFFVVRAPALPFEVLSKWGADLEAASASGEEWPAAVAADRAKLLQRLAVEVARPAFREAVFCASPSLDEAVKRWLVDPASPDAASTTTILVRYLSRMAARSTPFGLFSSCGVGEVGPGLTSLRLGSPPTRHTRLDMQYLTGLVQVLERDPTVRAGLRFWPSSGLYRLGDHLHHAEAEMRGTPPTRSYRLVSLDAESGLDVALDRARRGGALPEEVVAALLESDPTIDRDSAVAFVDELIESQVLVSELSPPITGPEPIHHVLEVLALRKVGGAAASALAAVRDQLDALDAEGIGQTEARYRVVAEELRKLPAPVELSRLFQVDLTHDARGSHLGGEVLAEVQRGLGLLHRIAVPFDGGELGAFATAFRERYEDREVPLAEALDDEVGVGFGQSSSVPSDLLEGLRFPTRGSARVPWSTRDAWLARRAFELVGARATCWDLDDEDLKALAVEPEVVPHDSLYVVASLSAPSEDALARGEFQVLVRGAGPNASTMLGRFCHADPILRDALKGHLRVEESLTPDAIFAEIVHQPEGRIGNILCRPVLRDHEIPYLARAGVDADHQIPIQDLLVSATPSGRVRLRSRRLGRWVEPRMSNAHNTKTSSLNVYRFLCALGIQRREAIPGWSWGLLAEEAPHLPRVSVGRVVFSLERWTLFREELEPFKKLAGPARLQALRALRERRGLPRWVALVDGDNVLPIDLENVLSAESFLDLVKQRTRAMLTEVFPAEGHHVVEGPRGRHASELVIPFTARRASSPQRPTRETSTVTRTFGPGSEWLYAKVYAGPSTGDATLREVVAPLARDALGSGSARSWFFIRYSDPHPHLRLRFRGPPDRLLQEVVPALHSAIEPWLQSGRVHRLELDTYHREIERYGGDRGIELAEAIFWADSEAALAIVRRFDGASDGEVRWRLALVGLDRLLDDLAFDGETKLGLLRDVRASFAAEFAADASLERELGARFRKVRQELEELVAAEGRARSDVLAEGLATFASRSRQLAPAVAELRARAAAGEISGSLPDLAASLLHMHANRMLAADHRAQELVLYDFLLRVYESRAARARKGQL